ASKPNPCGCKTTTDEDKKPLAETAWQPRRLAKIINQLPQGAWYSFSLQVKLELESAAKVEAVEGTSEEGVINQKTQGV
ncbi:MAG: hypothetical protein AB8B44_04770, partial [Prochlorococcus sp.]